MEEQKLRIQFERKYGAGLWRKLYRGTKKLNMKQSEVVRVIGERMKLTTIKRWYWKIKRLK